MFLAVCAVAVTAAAGGADRADSRPGDGKRPLKVPPPSERRHLGVHEPSILGGTAHGWRAADVARLADRAGFEIFRFTVDWVFVERTRDVWDERQWAQYEAAYQALVARGIRPLITVSTAPPWARDFGLPMLCGTARPCEYPPRTSMYGEWQEFLEEIARRFPQTAAIEIWNEPNMSGFWKPEPQPERYASLVASAYEAIKAANPRIKVIAGGLAGADRSIREPGKIVMSMAEFLRRAYPAGLVGHMDGISFHQANQSVRFGKRSQLQRAFRITRRVRGRYDTRRTPIWVTEFGLSTTDRPRLNWRRQARGLLRGYRRTLARRDVRAFVIHKLADSPGLPPSERDSGIGLIQSWDPLVVKDSYCAFAERAAGRRLRICR